MAKSIILKDKDGGQLLPKTAASLVVTKSGGTLEKAVTATDSSEVVDPSVEKLITDVAAEAKAASDNATDKANAAASSAESANTHASNVDAALQALIDGGGGATDAQVVKNTAKISELEGKVNGNSVVKNFTADDFVGMYYGSTVIAKTGTYDGVIFPLTKGVTYKFSGNRTSINIFDKVPEIGDVRVAPVSTDEFTPTLDTYKYLLVTIRYKDTPVDFAISHGEGKGLVERVTEVEEQIPNKVNKEEGKGLSTNDFSNQYKNEIDELSKMNGESRTETKSYSTGRLSWFVPAKENQKYSIKTTCNNAEVTSIRIIAYNDSASLGAEVTINSNGEGELETPEGTTRLLVYNGTSVTSLTNISVELTIPSVIDGIKSDIEELKKHQGSSSSLNGKKILCLGDSITEFDTAGKGWVEYANEMGGIFIQGAFGGSTCAQRLPYDPNPTTDIAAERDFDLVNLIKCYADGDFEGLDKAIVIKDGTRRRLSLNNLKANPISTIDIVFILTSTNDCCQQYASNVRDIGEVGTDDVTTICGAYKYIAKTILEANPNIKIYFASPLVRYPSLTKGIGNRDETHWCDVWENPKGTKLPDYVEAENNMAKYLHIPYFDLYHDLGWNQYNFTTFFNVEKDWTHPYNGWKVLAERIHSLLEANL